MTTEWNKTSPARAFRQGGLAPGTMVNPLVQGSSATFLFAFSARLS
jgi:hypothetical protein